MLCEAVLCEDHGILVTRRAARLTMRGGLEFCGVFAYVAGARLFLFLFRLFPRLQGWALCSVTFFYRPHATTSLYSVCTSSRIDTNPLTRTTRESRRTTCTVMLQKTPRAGDDDLQEQSHLVPDAGELSAAAHTDDSSGPQGSHTPPLSACDAPCAAQSSPVHPSPLRSTHPAGGSTT